MEESSQIPEAFLTIEKKLANRFPGAVEEHKYEYGEFTIRIKEKFLVEALQFTKEDEDLRFDYLTDITAVDHKERDKRFDVVYHLYSLKTFYRLRIKIKLAAGEKAASITGIWSAANWLEREVYDMFGIVFNGHPGLKRILLSEAWQGHPLCKEYPLLGDGKQPY